MKVRGARKVAVNEAKGLFHVFRFSSFGGGSAPPVSCGARFVPCDLFWG